MATAIRKHIRDFAAIMALVVIAAVVGWTIVQNQRLRVPVLEQRPFELRAEFSTAQAVTPGQGQTVRVAGVRIGDIAKVELEDGRAIVEMAVDREFLPIYRNATILLRPKTGLKDMFLELDPGDASAGKFEEGGTVPAANTAPDVNLEEILEALDSDTRDYLRLLLVGAGKGLQERDEDLGKVLGSLGPINRDARRLNQEVAKRRKNLQRLIHNLNVLFGEVARKEKELTQMVSASNDVFAAIASEDPNVRRAVRALPGAISNTRQALEKVRTFAAILGPTFENLRPFARNLEAANDSTRKLANATTGTLRDEIRPFVRAARKPISDLAPAVDRLADATPDLATSVNKLNRFFNMAAYNPNGAEEAGTEGRDEGYLYWLGWLAHNGNSIFSTQDAHGDLRRIYFTAGCDTIRASVANDPTGGLASGLIQLTAPGEVCG